MVLSLALHPFPLAIVYFGILLGLSVSPSCLIPLHSVKLISEYCMCSLCQGQHPPWSHRSPLAPPVEREQPPWLPHGPAPGPSPQLGFLGCFPGIKVHVAAMSYPAPVILGITSILSNEGPSRVAPLLTRPHEARWPVLVYMHIEFA